MVTNDVDVDNVSPILMWVFGILVLFTLVNFLCVDEAGSIFWSIIGWAHVLAVITMLVLLGSKQYLYIVLLLEISAWGLGAIWFDVVSVFWWINEWFDSREPVVAHAGQRASPSSSAETSPLIYEGVVVEDDQPIPNQKRLPMFLRRSPERGIPVFQAEDYCSQDGQYTRTYHDPCSGRNFCEDCGHEKP